MGENLKDSGQPGNKLTIEATLKGGRYYWGGIIKLQEHAIELTSQSSEKLSEIHKLCLNYLAERVLHGALHANFLFREYPYSSHADLAGINRGIIEASVNYLYLLDDPSCERTAAFWAKGAYEEWSRNDGLKKWINHTNDVIKNMAQSDYEDNFPTFEELIETISKFTGVAKPDRTVWPNFKQRCNTIGGVWDLVYDMEYKALSTWQHGDLSRIIISPSFARISPEQEDRNILESFGMLQWAFTLEYFFVRELAVRCKDTSRLEIIDEMFYRLLHGANAGIQEHIERFQPDKFSKMYKHK